MAAACGSNTNEDNPDNGTKKNPETGLKTVTYQLSNDEIANPERGLFTQYESNAKDYVALSYLRKLRSEGKTLVQLMYSHNEMVLELTNRKLRVRSDSNSSL